MQGNGGADTDYRLLSEESARALLDTIAPGSDVLAIGLFPGSFTNYTHLVEARSGDGSAVRVVVRRYLVDDSYDRGEKARREFKTLELVQESDIPVPRPLLLDDVGSLLGAPGIVTDYVSGEMFAEPADPLSCARALAAMLVRIHSVSCDAEARSSLMDANSAATWFLRRDTVPSVMDAHPDGAMLWQMLRDLLPATQPAPPTLVHIDYWLGNLLWDRTG